jgi:hypothetical protein
MCCYAITRVFLRLSANNELLYIWMEGEPSLARDRPRRDLGQRSESGTRRRTNTDSWMFC